MAKLGTLNPWLEEVEVVEERLEALKVAGWRWPNRVTRSSSMSVVRATAGLLAHKVPPGVVYERRLRRAWEHSFRKRTS